MRIFCPENWSHVPGVDYSAEISLEAIRPKAGRMAYVDVYREDIPTSEVINLLWKPPFTMLNGWSDKPSEIAISMIVSATASDRLVLPSRQFRYKLEILACEPLLRKVKNSSGNWLLEEYCTTTFFGTKNILHWEEPFWCGLAQIEGLTYICASTSVEAHMELVVEEIGDEMFGLLSTHFDPGGEYSYLGRRKFSTKERRAVKRAMKQAVQLTDLGEKYLVD